MYMILEVFTVYITNHFILNANKIHSSDFLDNHMFTDTGNIMHQLNAERFVCINRTVNNRKLIVRYYCQYQNVFK